MPCSLSFVSGAYGNRNTNVNGGTTRDRAAFSALFPTEADTKQAACAGRSVLARLQA
jgi:hypothetical protein